MIQVSNEMSPNPHDRNTGAFVTHTCWILRNSNLEVNTISVQLIIIDQRKILKKFLNKVYTYIKIIKEKLLKEFLNKVYTYIKML